MLFLFLDSLIEIRFSVLCVCLIFCVWWIVLMSLFRCFVFFCLLMGYGGRVWYDCVFIVRFLWCVFVGLRI